MKIKEVKVKNLLSKSNLPSCDYTINPYIGCPHACKYCYACYMRKFTNHTEQWGEFVDVKICDNKIHDSKLVNKNIFISSATDCYNGLEKKYEVTRKILEQLKDIPCNITISTKSSLILRDIDLLKEFKNLKVCLSINTLNERFKNDMDRASSIKERLETLKKLHLNKINTILFMSPIFPEITEWKEIIDISKDFVDEYWFEDLKLRADYKPKILKYIKLRYPNLFKLYDEIYNKDKDDYWKSLAQDIKNYCLKIKVNYEILFFNKKSTKIKVKENKDTQLSFL